MGDDTLNMVYVNSTAVLSTNFDFTLYFRHVVPNIWTKNDEVNNSLIISMSPEHTKAFYMAIKKQLDAFEKKYGVIEIPEAGLKEVSVGESSDKQL